MKTSRDVERERGHRQASENDLPDSFALGALDYVGDTLPSIAVSAIVAHMLRQKNASENERLQSHVDAWEEAIKAVGKLGAFLENNGR